MTGSVACSPFSLLQAFYSLVTTYVPQSAADLQSPHKLHSNDSYDFIIVGAGSAGCVLANRLSEVKSWKVLLIEAGGEEPDLIQVPAFFPFYDSIVPEWDVSTVPQPGACDGQPCPWPRAKVMGGCSAHNNMLYATGNRYDYDHWAELGNTGWSYEEVLHYFHKAKNKIPQPSSSIKCYGRKGYQPVGEFLETDSNVKVILKGLSELGFKIYSYSDGSRAGAGPLKATQDQGERASTNRAYLSPIRRDRPNLTIVTNVRVTKVLLDPETKTATGVEYALEHNRSIVGEILATKEVILSAGVIKSPQILMLSGIGPRDVLEPLNITVIQELKTGQNLQDHVGADGLFVETLGSANKLPQEATQIFQDVATYNQDYSPACVITSEEKTRRGPWASLGSLKAVAFGNSRYGNKSIENPDFQLTFYPMIFNKPGCPYVKRTPLCYYNGIHFQVAVLRPKSRGFVTINTTDPFVNPLVVANYFQEKHDMEVFTDAIRVQNNLVKTNALNGVLALKRNESLCKNVTYDSDEYWDCVARTTTSTNYHACCTVKMGPDSDPDSVVDPQLRVHGVKNLRVIDASIMPQIVSGNTNFPTVMIGEKGADMIKMSWDESLECH